MARIECPPYDYKTEPLITNNVYVNSDNLKRTIRWLVDSVQDHQQILYRHSQLWDSLESGDRGGAYLGSGHGDRGGPRLGEKASEAMRPTTRESNNSGASSENQPKESASANSSPRHANETVTGESENDGPILKSGEDSPSRGKTPEGKKKLKRMPTEGRGSTSFVNHHLGGELLDMKMKAMQRSLAAEVPRTNELEKQREKMLADMAAFTRDLNAKFVESDKKLHNDLSQATSKLYDQLTRISEDVLGRIELLEGLAHSNREQIENLADSRPGSADWPPTHKPARRPSLPTKTSSSDTGANDQRANDQRADDQSANDERLKSVEKGMQESRPQSVDKGHVNVVEGGSDKAVSEEVFASRPTSPTSVLVRDSQTEYEAETDRGTRPGSPQAEDSGRDQRPESSDKKSQNTGERPESRQTQGSDKGPESRQTEGQTEGSEKWPETRHTQDLNFIAAENARIEPIEQTQEGESNVASQKELASPNEQVPLAESSSGPGTRESERSKKSEGGEIIQEIRQTEEGQSQREQRGQSQQEQEKPIEREIPLEPHSPTSPVEAKSPTQTPSEPISPKTPTRERKPAWKPPVREPSETQEPAVPSQIGGWEDVQATLAKISQAQRDALDESRRDLADMADALAEESEERLRLQDELDAMKREAKFAQENFDELANELPEWLQGELSAWQKKQDRAGGSGRPASPVQAMSLKSRSSRPPSQASNREGQGTDEADSNRPPSQGKRPLAKETEVSEGRSRNDESMSDRPQSQGARFVEKASDNGEGGQDQRQFGQDQDQNQAQGEIRSRFAIERSGDSQQSKPPEASLKDLLNGAVKKSTDGHRSQGVKDEHKSAMKEAFKNELLAWRDDKQSGPTDHHNVLDGKPQFHRDAMHSNVDHVATHSKPNSRQGQRSTEERVEVEAQGPIYAREEPGAEPRAEQRAEQRAEPRAEPRATGKLHASGQGSPQEGQNATERTPDRSPDSRSRPQSRGPTQSGADAHETGDRSPVIRTHSMNGSQYTSSAFAQHSDSNRGASREGSRSSDERIHDLNFSLQQIESKHGDRIRSLEESLESLKALEENLWKRISGRPVSSDDSMANNSNNNNSNTTAASASSTNLGTQKVSSNYMGTQNSNNLPAEVQSQMQELIFRLNDIDARLRNFEYQLGGNSGSSQEVYYTSPPPAGSTHTVITSSQPEMMPATSVTSPGKEVPLSSTSPQPRPQVSSSPSSPSFQQAPMQRGQTIVQQHPGNSSPENNRYSELRVELDLVHKKLDALQRFQPQAMGVQPRNIISAGSTTAGAQPRNLTSAGSTTVGLDTARGDLSNAGFQMAFEGMPSNDLEHIQAGLQEMLRTSEQGVRGDVDKVRSVVQALQKDVKQFAGRTESILTRLKRVESRPANTPGPISLATAQGGTSAGQHVDQQDHDDISSLSARRQYPLPALLDAALDKHPADLSHLLDPQNGESTPLPFVSQRGLQKAVEGLTDNFRSWLDAIHQSIIGALENKADSTQLELILRQVNEAAGRTSESVAHFAKRAIGGHCASCDAPLSEESLSWKRPHPNSSSGRWVPRASAGAVHSIRPPAPAGSATASKGLSGIIGNGPPLGPSRLPKLQDLRSSRDFPKGKILKASSSDSALRVRSSDVD